MRAKLINEIRQDIEGSGLGPIGVGKMSVLKGFSHISKTWPKFLKDAETLKDIKDRHLAPVSEEIANWDFYCPRESILIMPKDYTPIAMDTWMENILSEVETYRKLDIPGFPDCHIEMMHSKKWHVGKATIYKTYSVRGNTKDRSLISTYYLIET